MSTVKKSSIKEIVRYLVVGSLTTVVSLGCYYFCVLTIFNPDNPVQLQISNIISWIASVTFAYFASRKYVFKSKNKNRFREMISFYIARVTTLIMDMLIMFIGVSLLHGNDKVVKLIVQVIVTVSNYIFSKIFVFNNKSN